MPLVLSLINNVFFLLILQDCLVLTEWFTALEEVMDPRDLKSDSNWSPEAEIGKELPICKLGGSRQPWWHLKAVYGRLEVARVGVP